MKRRAGGKKSGDAAAELQKLPPVVQAAMTLSVATLRQHASGKNTGGQWVLLETRSDCRIFVLMRNGDVVMFRVSCVVQGSSEQVATQLMDVDSMPRWWPMLQKASVAKQVGKSTALVHLSVASTRFWLSHRTYLLYFHRQPLNSKGGWVVMLTSGALAGSGGANRTCCAPAAAVLSGGGFLIQEAGLLRSRLDFVCNAAGVLGGWAERLPLSLRLPATLDSLSFVGGFRAFSAFNAAERNPKGSFSALPGLRQGGESDGGEAGGEQDEQGVEEEEEEEEEELGEFAWLPHNRFVEEADDVMDEMYKAITAKPADGWKMLESKEGVDLFVNNDPTGYWCVWVKGRRVIPLHPALLLDYVIQIDKKTEYDDMFLRGTLLEQIDTLTSCWHQEFKGKFPSSPRDAVHFQIIRPIWPNRPMQFDHPDALNEENLGYTVLARSCEHPKCPVSSSYVRATLDYSAMILLPKRAANGRIETEVHYINKTALGGSIPGWLIKMVTTSQPLIVNRIEANCAAQANSAESAEKKWRAIFTKYREEFVEKRAAKESKKKTQKAAKAAAGKATSGDGAEGDSLLNDNNETNADDVVNNNENNNDNNNDSDKSKSGGGSDGPEKPRVTKTVEKMKDAVFVAARTAQKLEAKAVTLRDPLDVEYDYSLHKRSQSAEIIVASPIVPNMVEAVLSSEEEEYVYPTNNNDGADGDDSSAQAPPPPRPRSNSPFLRNLPPNVSEGAPHDDPNHRYCPPKKYFSECKALLKEMDVLFDPDLSWSPLRMKHGVVLLERNSGAPGEIPVLMGVGELNFAVREVVDFLSVFSNHPVLDVSFKSGEVLEKLDEQTEVRHVVYDGTRCKAQSNVDVVYLSHHVQDHPSGAHAFLARSVEHAECRKSDDVCRVQILAGGWLVRPCKERVDSCIVSYVVQLETDNTAVSAACRELPLSIGRLRRVLLQRSAVTPGDPNLSIKSSSRLVSIKDGYSPNQDQEVERPERPFQPGQVVVAMCPANKDDAPDEGAAAVADEKKWRVALVEEFTELGYLVRFTDTGEAREVDMACIAPAPRQKSWASATPNKVNMSALVTTPKRKAQQKTEPVPFFKP